MTPTTSPIRPAAVAGLFYPDRPHELAAMIDEALDDADRRAILSGLRDQAPPHAVVVPHAGYVYSGPIAASAYRRVRPRRDEVRRVVLLGPAHRVPVRCMAVPSHEGFATPLGVVPVDDEARREALELPCVSVDDRPHAGEHSLEVQLPFLQRVLGPEGWSVLPLVVGRVGVEDVTHLLDRLWGGDETLVVVSSDLSHYHDHGTAHRLDSATAASVVARRWDRVAPEDACGAYPLRGLLNEAEALGLDVELLDLRTSADTAGDPDRVVGYGAFAVG